MRKRQTVEESGYESTTEHHLEVLMARSESEVHQLRSALRFTPSSEILPIPTMGGNILIGKNGK